MKKTAFLFIFLISFFTISAWASRIAPNDSVFVKTYRAGNGLRMSYSVDGKVWMPVGRAYNLFTSDFGTWGTEKKMASEPSVLRDKDGIWYAVWALNDRCHQFATTHTRMSNDTSQRLSVWFSQDYPYMTTTDENVINPILTKKGNTFYVTYDTQKGNKYITSSSDFIHWTAAKPTNHKPLSNNIIRCTWQEIDGLLARIDASAHRSENDGKGFSEDNIANYNAEGLKTVIKADLSNTKKISDELIGIFFEDINYAADGGLYAEMLQNRDFEYNAKDGRGWNAKSHWTASPADYSFEIADLSPIHRNNSHYATLTTRTIGGMIINDGFDGIAVKKGEKYDFSVLLRSYEKAAQKVRISLRDGDKVLASAILKANKGDWKQAKAVLTPNESCVKATLSIEPLTIGTIDVDFASLFPQNTFKHRKNGLRADLAQVLADMKPKFVRFPGGCATHGNGINNIYHWQSTVGPLWERQYDYNIWHYHQSRGLGFYEYFQFCEDIGAEPLPVLAAGVPCQNSSDGGDGQQGGIPWEKDGSAYSYNGKPLTMESYLQELLNLIEWANGDPSTSPYAKMRADAGHKAPFGLKYLGLGNEDLMSETFKERYIWLIKEVKKVYPEITIVGTVGPFWEGSDYEIGWDVARANDIEVVDEHYYNPVGWYLNHQNFYDNYSRTGTKVYLGEWASKGNRWENALAEAIHITNLERNADVVTMSSYAPLLAREGHTNWNPDLIYFNATEVKPTPNYYVQMLASQNAGVEYVFAERNISVDGKKADRRQRSIMEIAEQRVASSIVKTAEGDIVVKLVNALPATNEVSLELGPLAGKQAVMTQIASTLNAGNVERPEAKYLDIKTLGSLNLPPYSLSVIRISDISK